MILNMTKTGVLECSRRTVTLVLVTLGLISPGYWDVVFAGVFLGAAVLFYIFFPRIRPPAKALFYEHIPAVIGPDLLGFILTSVFIALPFWVGAGNDGYLYEDFILVHPAAVLAWPMALISSYMLVVAARYASYWIKIEAKGLMIHSIRAVKLIAFEQMTEVTPYRKGLPKWMGFLTPLLILSGKYTAAGAVVLARDTTGMTINLQAGSPVNIPMDSFEKASKKILKELHKHAVSIAPGVE
jgi:hypothetical protein